MFSSGPDTVVRWMPLPLGLGQWPVGNAYWVSWASFLLALFKHLWPYYLLLIFSHLLFLVLFLCAIVSQGFLQRPCSFMFSLGLPYLFSFSFCFCLLEGITVHPRLLGGSAVSFWKALRPSFFKEANPADVISSLLPLCCPFLLSVPPRP